MQLWLKTTIFSELRASFTILNGLFGPPSDEKLLWPMYAEFPGFYREDVLLSFGDTHDESCSAAG